MPFRLNPSTAPDPPLSTLDPGSSTPNSSDSASSAATASSSQVQQPRTFTDGLPLPKLLVFDLDYTLWPFWTDTHPSPPFRPFDSSGKAARDSFGGRFAFYREVPAVLTAVRAKGLKLAAASRTTAIEEARDLLKILKVEDGRDGERKPAGKLFDSVQIYPGSKVGHMTRIRKETGVDFADMVFYDDESRNADVEREKGVCFCLVKDGVTFDEVDRGVEKWRRMRSGKK